ncbi:MAG: hypothetical protein ACRDJE_18125 [Dehalococcoidia bacterium]
MENTEQATLVFKDREGEYYLLPQTVLEQGRVPEEHKVALEAEITTAPAAAPSGQDVQGFRTNHNPVIAGIIIGQASVLAGFGLARLIEWVDPVDVGVLDYSHCAE